jgi:pyrroline-5-carboxylate reductase
VSEVSSPSESTIALLGAGNMGQAILRGLVSTKTVSPDRILVTTRRPERAERLAAEWGVRAAASNLEAVEAADAVVIAVKPQILHEVVREVRSSLRDKLAISVAAGVSTARLEGWLDVPARVIRAMPNTPASIGQGATALARGAYAHDEDLSLADALFRSVGRTAVVDEEHLDAVTGLSGSGPAYVFLIIEAFADAGVKVGLSREVAQDLATQTIKGAAQLLLESGEHPGRLKDRVTSPGGTAIAGLHVLEAGGLRTTIMNAVEAAARRAKELGDRE